MASGDKILCPWCGNEMSDGWHENGLGRFGNYLCQECFAKSPDVAWPMGLPKEQFDVLNKAAALRRYTPPIKPLSWDEVQACDDDRTLFHERKGCSGFIRVWGNVAKVACQGFYNEREYGVEYRYWPDRKPTDEERSAAGWSKE